MIKNLLYSNSLTNNNNNFKKFTQSTNNNYLNWRYNNIQDTISFSSKSDMQQKNNKIKDKETQIIVNRLLEYDFEYLICELLANNRAYVGSSVVSIDKEKMPYIGISKKDSEDMLYFDFNIAELLKLLARVKEMAIKEYPEEKTNYNLLFQELEKKISN